MDIILMFKGVSQMGGKLSAKKNSGREETSRPRPVLLFRKEVFYGGLFCSKNHRTADRRPAKASWEIRKSSTFWPLDELLLSNKLLAYLMIGK
jgi:hypothetical protein